jgi:hypothetical protein
MTPEEAKQIARDIVDEACLGETFARNGTVAALEASIAAALLEAAGRWLSLEDAPTDKPVLVYDASAKRCVVAQHMTAIEDGSTAWVYARQIGMPGEGLAFIAKHPTHFRYLPEAPEAST